MVDAALGGRELRWPGPADTARAVLRHRVLWRRAGAAVRRLVQPVPDVAGCGRCDRVCMFHVRRGDRWLYEHRGPGGLLEIEWTFDWPDLRTWVARHRAEVRERRTERNYVVVLVLRGLLCADVLPAVVGLLRGAD